VGNLSRDSVPGGEALARALFDSDRLVRTLAARRLDSVFAEAAIPGWIALLRDHDPSLRERAAISLGVIGDPRAIAPLTALLQDPELAIRRQLVTALATIACGPSEQQELG
jgi:HEAT repeat protein